MAKTARAGVGKFNFSSPSFCSAPSQLSSEIAVLTTTSSALCGALAASLLINVLFGWIAIERADVAPYVADGGVFGCEVKSEAPR